MSPKYKMPLLPCSRVLRGLQYGTYVVCTECTVMIGQNSTHPCAWTCQMNRLVSRWVLRLNRDNLFLLISKQATAREGSTGGALTCRLTAFGRGVYQILNFQMPPPRWEYLAQEGLSADDSRWTLGELRLNCMRRFSDFGPRNDERDDLDEHWWLDSRPWSAQRIINRACISSAA